MLFDKIVLLVMLGAILTPFAISGVLWALDKILKRGRK